MIPWSTKFRISSRVIASAISSCSSGSSQTRRSPTSRMSAASRFCDPRSLIVVDLHFDVGWVQHANLLVLADLLDPLAFAATDLAGDPYCLGVAVDVVEVVGVVHTDFLEAAGMQATGGFRRTEAGRDLRAATLEAAALFREATTWAAPRLGRPLFHVVALALEGGFALALLLGECRVGFVVEVGRLVGVAAGDELRLDVLVGLFFEFLFRSLVFDLGLGLFGDFEITDTGFDTRCERVADAVDLAQFALTGGLDVFDRLVARLAERVSLRGADTADVF